MGFFDILFGNNEKPFNVGDRVRVKYSGKEGYVISVDGDMYMVSVNEGEIVDSYYSSQIEKCW